ncbi:MAG: TetR/AcrR family transcriptional regulator [Hyphomicrobiaceae bacterium]
MTMSTEVGQTASSTTDSRRRILDAAVACFARSGFHGTSMQEICQEARMSPGGLYRHFTSKDAIIEAIAAEERERNARYLGAVQAESDHLQALFDGGFAFLKDMAGSRDAALCAEVCAEAQRNPRIREIFEVNHRQARDSLTRAITAAQAAGEVDGTLDPHVVVKVLMAIADGLIVRPSFDSEMSVERIEPGLRALIHRMLRPQSETSTPPREHTP